MKLAPLLSQFLFAHKRLDLPGIGSFLLDPNALPDPEAVKHGKASLSEGISFESNPNLRENTELIKFISEQTGKMKALAAADLGSLLEQAQQFLNIGKPFLFDGIGSLVKVKSGLYEFAAAQALPGQVKEYTLKEINATSSTEDSFTDYQNVFNPAGSKTKWKRPVMALLLVLGFGLAIWGGYSMYKRKKAPAEDVTEIKKDDPKKELTIPVPVKDSVVKKDTIIEDATNQVAVKEEPKQVTPPGNYKFILETAGPKRAIERYNRLKSYYWNIHMETRDSIQFKLYMILPALASDTARMVDSMSVVYGRRVRIEH